MKVTASKHAHIFDHGWFTGRIKWHLDNLRHNKIGRHVPLAEQIEAVAPGQNLLWAITLLISYACAAILMYFWSDLVPFKFNQAWVSHGTLTDWLLAARWMLAWGTGITIIFAFFTRDKGDEIRHAEINFLKHAWISVRAGVCEEINFRWLGFMSWIIIGYFLNWVLGGFMGHGLLHWLMIKALGPVADFFTLGLLHNLLTNPAVWAIGLGLINANAAFRDGHKYLGWFGYVNSWFIGMFLFYMMLTYGLLAAIVVHAIYDLLIFTVNYLHCVIERAEGLGNQPDPPTFTE